MAKKRLTGDELVKRTLEDWEQAKSGRANWNSLYETVADFVRPDVSFLGSRTPGTRNDYRIFDGTAVIAHGELANTLEGTLMNSQIRWLSLVPEDPSIDVDDDEVERWLYAASSALLRQFDSANTNFTLAAHETLIDLTSWGTAAMELIERDDGFRFSCHPLNSIYLQGDDDTGEIDGVFRCFRRTGNRCLATWDKLPEKMAKAMDADPKREFEIVHAVQNRRIRDAGKVNSRNKPWSSIYLCTDTREMIGEESGFDSMPILTPRWEVAPGELYGRSPAIKAIADIKSINLMALNVLEATELTIRPPLMVPANGIEGELSTAPGSILYVKSGTREFPQPLNHGAKPDFGEFEIDRRERKINQHFLTDRLRLPDQDRMTATEILARQRQALLVFSPYLGRLYSEFLNPIVYRTFIALKKRNGLPPNPPAALAKANLMVAYTSPLAASRGASQYDAASAVLQMVLPLANAKPTAIDTLDTDRIIRLVARASGLDPRAIVTKKKVMQMEAERAQAMQMQQQSEVAVNAGNALKSLAAAGGSNGGR